MARSKNIDNKNQCSCTGSDTVENLEMAMELVTSLIGLHGERISKNDLLLYSISNLLVGKGILQRDELYTAIEQAHDDAEELHKSSFPNVYMRHDDEVDDKESISVNCEKRKHLCKGACCKLTFALSEDEVEAGNVKWDLEKPYYIRHEENGYCSHINSENYGCTIYNNRPDLCRAYSCKDDERIWEDFDNMIPNKEYLDVIIG